MTTSVRTPIVGRPRHSRLVVLITAVRAVLAFAIGVAILVVPDRGESALVGFMGAYFLVSGLFSLASARSGQIPQRMAFTSGSIGLANGILVLLYALFGAAGPPPAFVLTLLGLVIGLIGVLHLAGGFMVGERLDRWPTGHLLLGLLEILLAGILLVAPTRQGLISVAAAVWAFSAGSILALDATRAYRRWLSVPVDAPRASPNPTQGPAAGGGNHGE